MQQDSYVALLDYFSQTAVLGLTNDAPSPLCTLDTALEVVEQAVFLTDKFKGDFQSGV